MPRLALSSTSVLLAFGLLAASGVLAQGPNDQFGMNVHEIEFRPEAYPVVVEAEIPWVRIVAWWKWMEPVQGQINWAEMDDKVFEATGAGRRILVTFTSIPPWANGTDPNCDFWGGDCADPLLDPQYFVDFVTEVVNRYGLEVDHWEIWNEPDWHAFWNSSLSLWKTQILIPGSNAVHTANPGDLVVGPATYSGLGNFSTIVGDGCPHLDVLSIHVYAGNVGAVFNETDDNFQPYIQNNCNKPLWITESGVDSWDTGEAYQATQYVGFYEATLARSYIDKFFLFQWKDGEEIFDGSRGWGLVTSLANANRPKRSFWEVQDYLQERTGSQGAPAIRDTFANEGNDRDNGDPLDGTSSEVGGLTWTALSTVAFGDSTITNGGIGAGEHIGGIPFDPNSVPDESLSAIQADVVPQGANWIGVGFSFSAAGGYWTDGQLWMNVTAGGNYSVFADGLNHLLKQGPIPGFQLGALNRVRIEYDQDTNLASAWINGQNVLQDFSLNSISFVPDIHYGGFHMHSTTSSVGEMELDSFIIEVGVSIAESPGVPIFSDDFESGDLSAWDLVSAP